MLYELVEDPAAVDPAGIEAAIRETLSGIVAAAGVDAVVAGTDVDPDVVESLASGGEPALSVAQAAAILSVDDSYPEAETIARETLDDILLGMTTGVLDVDSVAANIDLDVSPKGVQQRIEGRTPMRLREYAAIKHFIASKQR